LYDRAVIQTIIDVRDWIEQDLSGTSPGNVRREPEKVAAMNEPLASKR
jgi:hypothetical protein